MGKEVICSNGYVGFFPLFLVSNTTMLILSIGKIPFFPPTEVVSFMTSEKCFLFTCCIC